jgi:hypothetical protein
MTETAREDIAQSGAIWDELVLLENHSGLPSVADDVGARRRSGQGVGEHVTAGGDLHEVERAQQSGFPRA